MCMQHGNLVFELHLTCFRESEMSGLNGGDLLSALKILHLPNSIRPHLLCMACPLSLPLPTSFTLLRLLTLHLYNPLPDLLLVFLALLLLLFLVKHSLPPFRSPPRFALNVFLSFLRLLCVQPLHESHRGGGIYVKAKLDLTYKAKNAQTR